MPTCVGCRCRCLPSISNFSTSYWNRIWVTICSYYLSASTCRASLYYSNPDWSKLSPQALAFALPPSLNSIPTCWGRPVRLKRSCELFHFPAKFERILHDMKELPYWKTSRYLAIASFIHAPINTILGGVTKIAFNIEVHIKRKHLRTHIYTFDNS